jgi:glutathione S-transferase
MYDIGPEAACDSRSMLASELDWLDTKLADGRSYLAGNRFSRVDLTVASLLFFVCKAKGNASLPWHLNP